MSRLAWDRRDFCGVLGLGPPRLRWAAAGPARRPCLRLGLRSRPGPLAPCGAAGPGSGPSAPLGSLRGRCGLSAGRLRPSARPRGSPGGPRCGVAGSGPRRPWLAGGSAPSSGGLGRGALVACRPLSGPLRSCRLPACAPSLVAPGPPPRGPVGRPAKGVGRRASSAGGRAVAALRAAVKAARAPQLGRGCARPAADPVRPGLPWCLARGCPAGRTSRRVGRQGSRQAAHRP